MDLEVQAQKEILALLDQKKKALQESDYFKLLDVPEDADDNAVKAAYFKLARLVHPDSLKKVNLKERVPEAVEFFKRITEAQDVLLDPQRRRTWLQMRAATGGKIEDPGVLDEQARIAMHQARLLMNRRAWPQAQEVLTRYSQYKPDDPKGLVLLGWCIVQNQTTPLELRLEEAKKLYNRALKLDDKNAEAHYYMALYFKEKGDFSLMEVQLDKALDSQPDHVGAQREKRLLGMRGKSSAPKPAAPAGPSLSDKLKGFFANLNKQK